MSTGGSSQGTTGGSAGGNTIGSGGNAISSGGSLSGGAANTGGRDNGGGAAATGGVIGNTGGSSAAGGNPDSGGTSSKSTGGTSSPGGTSNSGGSQSTGGSKNIGGLANTGGITPVGGGSATGGKSGGICPGGTYPVPTLTGTPTRVYNATGSGQFEGTVWDASTSVLFFSNMATGSTNPVVPSQVQRLTPPNNTVDTPVTDSGTNGLALDVDGSLLGCSHKVQGIVRVNPTAGTVSTLLNTDSNGKHFNSPNDLTVRSDGTIYFTDPDYQLGSSRTSETGTKGIYRVTPARQVSLVDGTFGEPNGVALSPDEGILYVSDMTANAIRKFTVASDGSTSNKQNFATVTNPDGVAVDCAGNLYWASNSAGKVIVLSPSGSQIGSITVATGTTNLAFGGADRKTLYISAGMAIYTLPLNVPGYPY